MQCEKPIKVKNADGEEIEVPCRKCILCRKRRCRDWAIKLIKESLYYKKMCMITLTFSPDFLMRPVWVKLRKYKKRKGNIKNNFKDIKWTEKYKTVINPTYIHDVKKTKWLVTRFIKKLRKWAINRNPENFISYFGAGEHGSNNTHRAHWHIIFFGLSKEDLQAVISGKSVKGKDIYFSPIIHKLWNFKDKNIGMHSISDVTTKTIKYTANYTLKKMYKEKKDDNSKNIAYNTDFIFSNQNKIGYKWARRSSDEIAKGIITDEDGCKYAIPESFKKELKRYIDSPDLGIDCYQHINDLSDWELNVYEKFKDINPNEIKENNYRKARRIEYLAKIQQRDIEAI